MNQEPSAHYQHLKAGVLIVLFQIYIYVDIHYLQILVIINVAEIHGE